MSLPVFSLKNYQIQTLGALRKFLEKTVEFNDADTAFYSLTKRPFVQPPSFPGLPYVCLRIPTGGGKTILAAHSVAVAADSFLRWSPFSGQIGGSAKLGSGLRHAASSMPVGAIWTSAGVCPPKAV